MNLRARVPLTRRQLLAAVDAIVHAAGVLDAERNRLPRWRWLARLGLDRRRDALLLEAEALMKLHDRAWGRP